jgi:hypothetical protein
MMNALAFSRLKFRYIKFVMHLKIYNIFYVYKYSKLKTCI